MGQVVALSRRPRKPLEVYSPVNYRPTDICRTLIFDPSDGNGYGEILDAVAAQYAVGESAAAGYHVVETPDSEGPLLRYLQTRPDGSLCVQRRKQDAVCHVYKLGEVRIVGLVFQFIRNLETGERWELIHGPAHEGENATTLPLYEAKA